MIRAWQLSLVWLWALCACSRQGFPPGGPGSPRGAVVLPEAAGEAVPAASMAHSCEPRVFTPGGEPAGATPGFGTLPPACFEAALVQINRYRAASGLPPVRRNPALDSIAGAHLADLALHDMVTHAGSDGSSLGDRLLRGGYRARLSGENLGGGHGSYREAIRAWTDSPGHRANLLLPGATEIGMAAYHNPASRYGTFWGVVLARPSGAW